LTAFTNSNVELVVTVKNKLFAQLMDLIQALKWVTIHIKPYFPITRINAIVVGNEISTQDDNTLLTYLVLVMVNIHGALVQFGLDLHTQVFMPNSLEVLEESYLPSAGNFKSNVYRTMLVVL
jgi:hypothetical protein